MSVELGSPPTAVPLGRWRGSVLRRLNDGDRFAGVYVTTVGQGARLTALLAGPESMDALNTFADVSSDGILSYPALSGQVPAAFWYERAIHDLSGVIPLGHPRLDPLLLALPPGAPRPRPGQQSALAAARPVDHPAAVDVEGRGMFVIPFGPVRSGVFESLQYLIETPGEDIPHLNIRPTTSTAGWPSPLRVAPSAMGSWWPSGSRGSPQSVTHWPSATRWK